jgi:hypothetical protein
MRFKQDRSRRAGHKGALNTQDFPPQRLTPEERALSYFRAWIDMRPKMAYYDRLPPAQRRIVDRAAEEADAAGRDSAIS